MACIKFRVYRPVVPILTDAVGVKMVRLPRRGFPAPTPAHPPAPCSLPR